MYHAVIIKESLADKTVLDSYKTVKIKVGNDWHLHILEIPNPERAIEEIQPAMAEDEPWYFHIFDEGKTLIVVFKSRVFRIDPNDQATWKEVQEYGARRLHVPEDELEFFPTCIADEPAWLAGKN